MSELLYPYGFIYETTCIPKNMKYRGSHRREQNPDDPDDSWYLGSPTNPQFWEDLEEYGRGAFRREILEEIYTDKHDLKLRESFYLKQVDAKRNPMYYNRSNSAEYGGGYNEGMRIVHKDGEDRFFYDDEVEEAFREGWSLGRSLEKIESNAMKNTKIVQKLMDDHPEIIIRLNEARDSNNPMNSIISREKVAESKRGKIWINNGIEMRFIDPHEFSAYKSCGYVRGMIRTKHIVPKDYDHTCKVCGINYKGGKYSTMCKQCYSDMKRRESLVRGGNSNG